MGATRASGEEASRLRHLLSRTTFGIRAGQVDGLYRKGAGAWLREQLNPPPGPEPEVEPLLRNFYFTGRTSGQFIDHVLKIAPPSEERDGPFAADIAYQQVIYQQLLCQRILRCVFSRWQLREVLTDFWFNHFNATMDKEVASIYGMPSYERDAIRPHALGRFRDLLGAVARHPVLLEFLDNKLSDANSPGGLNENYGREMLELYTVSVDAKYTQKDVVESSRCFTGWGYDMHGVQYKDAKGRTRWKDWVYRFQFDPSKHASGPKKVLSCTVPAGGMVEDGDRLLDYLAAHPATARFVSRKLATRLVADKPPESLVERGARTFMQTGGHIGRVVEAILTSSEFYDRKYRRAKLKTPLEFLASCLRACPPKRPLIDGLRGPQDEGVADMLAGRTPGAPNPLLQILSNTSAPYRVKAPFGWIDRSSTWATSTGVRDRLEVAVLVASHQPKPWLDPEAICEALLGGEVSEGTRKAVREAAAGSSPALRPHAPLATALMSQEFQHR